MSETDLCWKTLAERMEEDVLDKYKVEKSERGTFKGRGNPLEWIRVRRNKRYKIRKWREACESELTTLRGRSGLSGIHRDCQRISHA